MQDRTVVRVLVVPPDFISLLFSGATTLANIDRTTRLCLFCFLYFIKPHSEHHLYFSSKNNPLNITPFPYNLFRLFLFGKNTNRICTNNSKSPLILRVVLIAR